MSAVQSYLHAKTEIWWQTWHNFAAWYMLVCCQIASNFIYLFFVRRRLACEFWFSWQFFRQLKTNNFHLIMHFNTILLQHCCKTLSFTQIFLKQFPSIKIISSTLICLYTYTLFFIVESRARTRKFFSYFAKEKSHS